MRFLLLPFTHRFGVYTISILMTGVLFAVVWHAPHDLLYLLFPLFGFVGLTALGTHDLLQTKHALLRNYPISAHLRFLLEEIRPEMRQYFFEDEKHGLPFSRNKRAVVYQRAKMVLDKRPLPPS